MEIFFINIEELSVSVTYLILDFGCISFIILCVCFVNSSNVMSQLNQSSPTMTSETDPRNIIVEMLQEILKMLAGHSKNTRELKRSAGRWLNQRSSGSSLLASRKIG
jgi:hypothetical protein